MKISVMEGMLVRHHQASDDSPSVWFLHGFADSGLAYRQVFYSPLKEDFNLYVVDFPGFGASPINLDYPSIQEHTRLLLKAVVREAKGNRVSIVAHSLSGLIGTWICQHLKEQVNHYVNVEGNLTEADSYFSRKPLKYETSVEFAKAFEQEIFEKSNTDARYRSYYSSVRLADPEGMRNWSLTSQEFIKNDQCGLAFKNLRCDKTYVWGDVDTPQETQTFIHEHHLPNRHYEGIGHWPMVENTDVFYYDIGEIIKSSQTRS